jgi:membrane protein YdbS with pleckstrin-like domain
MVVNARPGGAQISRSRQQLSKGLLGTGDLHATFCSTQVRADSTASCMSSRPPLAELAAGSSVELPPVMSDLERRIQAIQQPDRSLLTYYLLCALVVPPAFVVLAPILYCRYRTMRYKFTEDGISMSWGVLFRRQIIVNYARIQDIHLKSNVVERWLGLARILIQTASGSSSAEMTIEGIKEFEALRDYLYFKMRGVKDHREAAVVLDRTALPSEGSADELARALREVARELRAVREALERPTPR